MDHIRVRRRETLPPMPEAYVTLNLEPRVRAEKAKQQLALRVQLESLSWQ